MTETLQLLNLSSAKMFSEEDTITSDPVTIVLSNAGWIRSAKGHEIDPSTLSYRGEDKLKTLVEEEIINPAYLLMLLAKLIHCLRIHSLLQEAWVSL